MLKDEINETDIELQQINDDFSQSRHRRAHSPYTNNGIDADEPSALSYALRTLDTTDPIRINDIYKIDLSPQCENELDEYTSKHSMAFLHNIGNGGRDEGDENILNTTSKSAKMNFSAFSMNELDNLCIRSNSPFLLSKNNSNNSSDTEADTVYSQSIFHKKTNSPQKEEKKEDADHFQPYTPMYLDKIDNMFADNRKYKKLTYKDVVKSLSHYYDDYNKYSNEMDILITYIRGQKNLYSQSSTVTYMKLYFLLMLALCITAFVTIVTPFIESQSWNVVLITTCNAIATFIISVTRYLKLEFTGNAYSFLANNYEKFENSLEIANNKMVFITNESEQNKILLDKIKELEFKIGEMKDIFQVIIPNEVKVLFPVISHINIFSLIKKMESHKTNLIVKFKDIKNEINYIIYYINHRYKNNIENLDDIVNLNQKEKQRVLFLTKLKENIKTELINYKDAYNQLDYLFTKEIQFAETHISMVYFMSLYYLCFGKPKYLSLDKYSNSVIQDYLKIILYDD